ncbi:dTDP-glucose 4,6-dehydratase [Candidatus Pacearchaeota archaeon]|nr:dTDP-glucose 4,6-dehydratase [Candidatus Pacearchaeota archaeon]
MKVLITGGCGFIGSNFIKYILTDKEIGNEIDVVNLDKISYAGSGKNIEYMNLAEHKRYKFIKENICDKNTVNSVILREKPDVIFNFAAESHVDRSIQDSDEFEKTNFVGACNIFKSALENGIKKVIQISTDEVYGSINQGSFSEESKINPTSPYSASKAAADIYALAYFKTHGLPIIITRSANNFGPYQFPEKILPLFITNLIDGKKVPLMWSEENPGLNVRDWLHVKDNCRAIWFASQKGEDGEIYNIQGENEKTNIHTTYVLLKHLGLNEDMIEKIPHRKAHDFRYSVSGEKLKKLGFKHLHNDFENEIKKTIEWYKENANWWRPLKKNQ